uniref:P-type domain-containing protein n=1 Tax=Ornithorhynchus anatinus TaxID=9258 RepID=A0A6I8P0L3_ORNAN
MPKDHRFKCKLDVSFAVYSPVVSYISLQLSNSEECIMEVKARRNCGFPGISPEACAKKRCCFDDHVPEVPWCFYPIPKEGCSFTR